MKVSIVTVSFNQAPFLEQALLSVLEQDYDDIEYIVVDPGSSDGSRDIIERYRHRLSKVVYQRDNGAAEGLNNGLAQATGEIFGFLNSDDLLLPGAISLAVESFRSAPNIDVVMGHTQIIDAEGRWVRNSYADRYNRLAFAYQACVFCQQSTFFRADLFHKSQGFNNANRVAWDAELFVDMFANSRRTVMLDRFLSAFRVHSAAITGGATLNLELRQYEQKQFRYIVGRPWSKRDHPLRVLFLIRKYLLEPRSLWQRLRYGSVYGRYAKRPGKQDAGEGVR